MLIYNKFILKAYIYITALLSVGLIAIVDSRTVLASEIVKFSVSSVQSEKQISKNVSYFDLMLLPGEEHILEIDIFNNDENPMNASVKTCTAGTNPGGVIEYDNINVTDDSLKVSFSDIATVEKPIISVPGAGSSRLKINVKMPDTLFDGVMLGGIVIKKVETPDSVSDNGGTSIQNEYCYVIAVQIRINETTVEPEFRLRYVEPTVSNYHTSIAANLQNYHAAIAKDVKIDALVYYNNEPNPLYSNSIEDFDVAPNSNFDFIIPCSGRLAAGEYRLLLTAALDDRTWEFDEAFSITAPVANDINEQVVNVPGVNYYFICLIILLIILLLIIIWLILAKRKAEKR